LRIAWLVVGLVGCGPRICGGTSFDIGGAGDPNLMRWDADPTTPEMDTVEKCGTLYGAFGERRTDIGVTSVVFDPNTAKGSIDADGDLAIYLLPVANVYFLTEHLAVGASLEMSSLAGGGLHHPNGQAGDTYNTYALSDGTLDVVDQRTARDANDPVFGDDHPEEWRLSWHLEYGGTEIWDGEDWVEITDSASNYGDLPYYPPDYSPS
jgi:hypothetical protein